VFARVSGFEVQGSAIHPIEEVFEKKTCEKFTYIYKNAQKKAQKIIYKYI
jgi:hypothetical protein